MHLVLNFGITYPVYGTRPLTTNAIAVAFAAPFPCMCGCGLGLARSCGGSPCVSGESIVGGLPDSVPADARRQPDVIAERESYAATRSYRFLNAFC
jgi:hypothetical protein